MKKIYYFLFLLIFLAACNNKNVEFPSPPTIEAKAVSETYHGKEVVDEYRNLENLEDTIVQQWFKRQAVYADSILHRISGRKALIEKIKELDSRKPFTTRGIRVTDNDQYFYYKKLANEDRYKLYYRKSFNGKEELLYDPANFKPETGNYYAINYIKPSWDGKYIVVSLSYDGKEISEMIIIDMETRKPLSQIITNCWPDTLTGVSWLPDNSGFIYLHFPVIDTNDSNFKRNTQSVLYKIGTDPKKLKILLSAQSHPKLKLNPQNYPAVSISSGNDLYAIAYISGVSSFNDALYTDISNLQSEKIIWKPLYTKEDKVVGLSGSFNGDQYIFKSAQQADNYKIAAVNMNDINFSDPAILVEEKKDEFIGSFRITSKGLFYSTTKNGVEASLYHKNGSVEALLGLPKKAGDILLRSKGSSYSDFWVYLTGWTTDYERYKYNFDTKTFIEENIDPSGIYPEFENLVVEEVLVPSHDGVLVPLSLVYDKSLEKNGKNPILIDGYGAYGYSMEPYFSPVMLSWVTEGGIYAVAHVRGGGEKGNSWHKDGFKNKKPNTWKDLIACTEYTIKEGYTSKEKTAILSSSAGGIMVGRAMTERPDLFAVVISQSGMMNPMRSEFRPGGGGTNYEEYGTIKDSLECMGLIAMDPYLHIEKDKKYPATLLTTGMNDPRITPWIPGKFAAKLQAYNTSENPILLDVNYNSGHGISDSMEEVYEEWATIFSFTFWQTGHPNYQYNKK